MFAVVEDADGTCGCAGVGSAAFFEEYGLEGFFGVILRVLIGGKCRRFCLVGVSGLRRCKAVIFIVVEVAQNSSEEGVVVVVVLVVVVTIVE